MNEMKNIVANRINIEILDDWFLIVEPSKNYE